jgi:hypothetical protein
MSVHIITYGCVDLEEESICAVWDTHENAVANAEYLAQECLDDSGLAEDGYYYEHEDGITYLKNSSGDPVEWWKIEEHEVLS